MAKIYLTFLLKGMLSMIAKRNFWMPLVIGIFVMIISFLFVYNIYRISTEEETEVPSVISEEEEIKQAAAIEKETIGENTEIIYEYYYMGDGETKSLIQEPSYYMLGMTREEVEENYSAWQLKEFSEGKVVLRKNLAQSSRQKYIIGVYKGYVAVFVEENDNKTVLKELTKTPVASLTKEEQYRLELGIGIVGEEALISALEDYSS